MRRRICTLGGWFLWGSAGGLGGIIAVALVGPVVATVNDKGGEVVFTLLKSGFAFTAAAFLLGMLCHVAEELVQGSSERDR